MSLRTSITIIPPAPVQRLAVPLLRQYAYDLPRRLPAHISVLYPFVPTSQLAAATRQLRALCQQVRPFSVTVAGYGQFPGVVYMRPQPAPALTTLVRLVEAAFPACTPYDGMFDTTPAPHITVGVFNSRAKQNAATLPDYPPQTFTVDRLYTNIGDTDYIVPWLVQDVVTLGG